VHQRGTSTRAEPSAATEIGVALHGIRMATVA
jgi:hypothetical protein